MKSLRIMVPLVAALSACQCNERARLPGASDEPPTAAHDQGALAPGARSSLTLGTQCPKLLPPSELEAMCGVSSVRASDRSVVRYDCERRFSVGGDERSLLVLWATNELDEASARLKFERGEAEAKTRPKYAVVPGLEFAARTYFRTFGAGDDFRRMHVIEAYSGPFTLKLELPRHPDANALCAREKLPELAGRVLAQIKALDSGSELPAPPAKTAEVPPGAAAAPDDKAPQAPAPGALPAAASEKAAVPAPPAAPEKTPAKSATKK